MEITLFLFGLWVGFNTGCLYKEHTQRNRPDV